MSIVKAWYCTHHFHSNSKKVHINHILIHPVEFGFYNVFVDGGGESSEIHGVGGEPPGKIRS